MSSLFIDKQMHYSSSRTNICIIYGQIFASSLVSSSFFLLLDASLLKKRIVGNLDQCKPLLFSTIFTLDQIKSRNSSDGSLDPCYKPIGA